MIARQGFPVQMELGEHDENRVDQDPLDGLEDDDDIVDDMQEILVQGKEKC